MTMTYESWRVSFQDAEQAARAAYKAAQEHAAGKEALAAHANRLASWIKQHGWHSDGCSVFDLDDEGVHEPCSCGLVSAYETPTKSIAFIYCRECWPADPGRYAEGRCLTCGGTVSEADKDTHIALLHEQIAALTYALAESMGRDIESIRRDYRPALQLIKGGKEGPQT